jgi:hypothetical protein
VPALAIVLILFAALTAAALAASTNFTEPNTSPAVVGDTPFAASAGDLDGDGDPDLAVANLASDNVTVLKNGGSANFNQPPSSPESAGDSPRSIAIADFDGDTDQDLAVANSTSANVTVLLNTGSGNFTPAATSPEATGTGPSSIVAADLDGDGDSDLATANANSSNVTVLRNVGGGDFVQPASSPEPAGNQTFAITAVNLDGDADVDLATANIGLGNVTILKNNGAANFNEPASSPEAAGPFASSIVAFNLDGDTDQDLAVANSGSTNVTILRNAGSGNFTAPPFSPEPAGSDPIALAAADFDLDDDADLAVANNSTDTVTILRNPGSGNFTQPATSPESVGDNPRSVAAADFDGDGDADLAIADAAADRVTILRNN